MAFPAFLDACVLYSGTLNDTLLRIADEEVYRPQWSDRVLDELSKALRESAGLSSPAVVYRIDAMRGAFPSALVAGFEPIEPGLTCHPKDRHVLAAAIHSGSQVLVTFNLKDFPAMSVSGFDVDVVHPDEFLLDQIDLYPVAVRTALLGQIAASLRPRLTVQALLGALTRAGVPKFAIEARRNLL